MTRVLVHGVPEVDAIWNPLVAALAIRDVHDVVRLSPPGFGAPTPAGWVPSMGAYASWLIRELEALAATTGPVDLVGHDWGAGHVFGALVQRPDLARTWATDVVGLIHPNYVWHDTAQAWQTPGVGEQVINAMVDMSIEERRGAFARLGLADDVLSAVAAGVDAEMGRCILGLYRDAAQPAMTKLGDGTIAATLPPGLGIMATADAYVSLAQGEEMIARLGARTLTLADRGHWWMVEDPDTAAQGLIDFWAASD
jgi:pimeloyl-ACP methyl ester carboxylesterase